MYLTKLKAIGTTVLVGAALVLAGVAVHATVVGEAAGSGGREPSPRAGGVPDGREPGATWKARATLEGHKDEVVCLAFGPDRLATADKGGSVKVWDTDTGKEERTYSYPADGGPMEAMAFTPGGNGLLLTYGDRLVRWDVSVKGRPAPKGVVPGEIPLPALLTVNELWVLRRDVGKQWAWEQRSALTRPDTDVLLSHPAFAARALLRRAAAVPAVALTSGGATLAVGGDDGTLTLWDVRTRKARASCKGPADDLLAVEFSADGKTLASAGKSGTVRLWEAATGKELAVLKGHDRPVRSVALSPDGTTLASGGDDKTVAVWDVKAAKRLAVLEGHTGPVLGVAFSGDGKLLASAGKDKTVRLWGPKQAEQPDALKERLAPLPPEGALPQAELQGRIEQYERAFRAQTQFGNRHPVVDPKAPGEVGNANPIEMLVTLEKVTVGKLNGESRSIAAAQTTLGAENPFFKPLKFENLAVLESAKITDNGKEIRFTDLKPLTVVRVELEPRPGTFVVVGIEKVGAVK